MTTNLSYRQCAIADCFAKHKARGYCNKHLERLIQHNDPLYERPERQCSLNNCSNKHLANGLCRTHYLRKYKYGDVNKMKLERHGKEPLYLYRTWCMIKVRIFNQNNHAYRLYGGRGITMHDEWINSFSSFRDYILKELGDRPKGKYSLDRIDNNGNYEPGNLRWATALQQVKNRRPYKRTASHS